MTRDAERGCQQSEVWLGDVCSSSKGPDDGAIQGESPETEESLQRATLTERHIGQMMFFSKRSDKGQRRVRRSVLV